jgi:hypothetical protein
MNILLITKIFHKDYKGKGKAISVTGREDP